MHGAPQPRDLGLAGLHWTAVEDACPRAAQGHDRRAAVNCPQAQEDKKRNHQEELDRRLPNLPGLQTEQLPPMWSPM
jgi:hypothetical protein